MTITIQNRLRTNHVTQTTANRHFVFCMTLEENNGEQKNPTKKKIAKHLNQN